MLPAAGAFVAKPLPRRAQFKTDVPAMLFKLDGIMSLQYQLIELGEQMVSTRRWQLLCVNFQSGTIIVFNTYNLVMYMFRLALRHEKHVLDIDMALLYYGYQILVETIQLILIVLAFAMVQKSLNDMLHQLTKFHIFAEDESLKCRLSQLSANMYSRLQAYTVFGMYPLDGRMLSTMLSMTVTYIVILIQTAGEGDICTKPQLGKLDSVDIDERSIKNQ